MRYGDNTIKNHKVLFLIIFIVICVDVSAQFIGTSSNYSGSHGLAINPSLMTTSYVYGDIGMNLGFSAYNDFAYLHAKDIYSLLDDGSTSYYDNIGGIHKFGFLMNEKPKNAYQTLDLNVISGMFSKNAKSAFGFFLNNRVYTDGKRIPWEIMQISAVGIENGDYIGKNYKSDNSTGGSMIWSELGLSYSRTVHERYYDKIDFGITVKGLLGYAGVCVNLNEVDKDIVSKNESVIHYLDMTAAVAGPIDYTANFADGKVFDENRMVNGYGAGFDIGVTYTRKVDEEECGEIKMPCTAPVVRYVWRLGVSLLDVGAIKFKNNAKVYKLGTDTDKTFDIRDLEGTNNVDELMMRVSDIFYGDTLKSLAGNSFMMSLPTAVSVQFDYNFYKKFYVNATLIQPIQFFEYSSIRPALFVAEPRFESEYFEIGIPVTLYDYEKVYVGTEIRFAFLTVGTHNIFNFLAIGDTYGMDVYVGLKFNLYKGKCRRGPRDACWNSGF